MNFIKKIILKYILIAYRFAKANDIMQHYQEFRNRYEIDSTFRFNGEEILFYGEGEIICKKNSYIGSYSTLLSVKDKKIVIGEGCCISHNVRLYTSSFIADQDLSNLNILYKSNDIIIGDFVWIGANVFINPGVEIGNNSVIGANSVVTKDVSPFSIVGGVPAKLIRLKK